jgi:hypothetical protein
VSWVTSGEGAWKIRETLLRDLQNQKGRETLLSCAYNMHSLFTHASFFFELNIYGLLMQLESFKKLQIKYASNDTKEAKKLSGEVCRSRHQILNTQIKLYQWLKFLTNIDNCHLPAHAFKELAHCMTVCCLATSWRSNNELSKAVHDDWKHCHLLNYHTKEDNTPRMPFHSTTLISCFTTSYSA